MLDESFPQPIIGVPVLRKAIRGRLSMEVARIEDVGSDLLESYDHNLIRALVERGIEGLITCDDAMLYRPEVQRAIRETGFSIVSVPRGTEDPIMATGVVLAHLREIATDHKPGEEQIWQLGVASVHPKTTADL